ncbi:uncharacterized protein [Nicotiana sylvestris]|uniref:uncharacterized protein n=1 Tax=Nicotiana sylvestris TaxID=4096 RepID=UPI00388C8B6D
MKAQTLADHMAENPVDDEYQPLSTYFPDEEVNSVEAISEDINTWKMFFDGAVNAKGVGIREILISPTGQHYPATTRLWFFCTNNTTEYKACIMGMNMAIDQDIEELLIMGDSNLIIQQAQGEWKTRDVKLIPYRKYVEDLSKWFKSIEFRYIPRCHNELADALATLASMLPYPGNAHIDPLEIQIRERHGYCNTVEAEPNVQPWWAPDCMNLNVSPCSPGGRLITESSTAFPCSSGGRLIANISTILSLQLPFFDLFSLVPPGGLLIT